MRLPKPIIPIGAPRFELGKWRRYEDDPNRIPLGLAGGMRTDVMLEKAVESPSGIPFGRRMDAPGLIYAIQAHSPNARRHDSPIKIGSTLDDHRLALRLGTLQTSHWLELRVVWTMPGTQADERALHRLCDQDRIRGEWFHPGAHVTEWLNHYSSDEVVEIRDEAWPYESVREARRARAKAAREAAA